MVGPTLQATREILGDVHTQEYLEALHTSNMKVVQVRCADRDLA
jgi:hypothetical protein